MTAIESFEIEDYCPKHTGRFIIGSAGYYLPVAVQLSATDIHSYVFDAS
jgi:hypothetical protein